MGLDGFSMSNLGINRNMSSAQLANEVEATAKQALENQMADVDGVGKKEKAGRKDPDAAFNGTIPFVGEPKEKEDEEESPSQENTNTPPNPDLIDDEDDEYGAQFHFRFNQDNMIEVWDSEKQEIVKTISPEDATNAILGLSKMPSVFVNKEI